MGMLAERVCTLCHLVSQALKLAALDDLTAQIRGTVFGVGTESACFKQRLPACRKGTPATPQGKWQISDGKWLTKQG